MKKIEMPTRESKNFLEVFEMFALSQAAKGVADITIRNYRTQIQNCLQNYMYSHKYTFRKILLELDKAKLVHSAHHPDNCRLLNPPTKTQKEIMEQLGLNPNLLGAV